MVVDAQTHEKTNFRVTHGKNNLKLGFRETGMNRLYRNEVLEQLPKAVLEESLVSMAEHVGKMFFEELNIEQEGGRNNKRWVTRDAIS